MVRERENTPAAAGAALVGLYKGGKAAVSGVGKAWDNAKRDREHAQKMKQLKKEREAKKKARKARADALLAQVGKKG